MYVAVILLAIRAALAGLVEVTVTLRKFDWPSCSTVSTESRRSVTRSISWGGTGIVFLRVGRAGRDATLRRRGGSDGCRLWFFHRRGIEFRIVVQGQIPHGLTRHRP